MQNCLNRLTQRYGCDDKHSRVDYFHHV